MAKEPDSYILNEKKYDRSAEWNEAGWTGKGVNVWDMESYNAVHGRQTTHRVLHAAPEANVITMSPHATYENGECTWSEMPGYGTIEDFIIAEQINVCTSSIGGTNGYGQQKFYTRLRDKYKMAMFNSAGNESSNGITAADSKTFMLVGACVAMKGDTNNIRMAGYSSMGKKFEDVDFTTFAGHTYEGTSFSTPYLAGFAAMLKQRYGKDMTQDEIYQYFKMCAVPIATEKFDPETGYDYWSGWGQPVLPHVDKKLLRLTIDDKRYQIDGQYKTTDVAPFIKDSRTFIPIAFIAEELGADVSWNAQKKEVKIVKDGIILIMTINNTEYEINGITYTMDTAPFIKDRRTCVPLAFVALALGCKVAWVASERKVLILEGENEEEG